VDKVVVACPVDKLALSPYCKDLLEVDQLHTVEHLFHVLALPEDVGPVAELVQVYLFYLPVLPEVLLVGVGVEALAVELDFDVFALVLADRVGVDVRPLVVRRWGTTSS